MPAATLRSAAGRLGLSLLAASILAVGCIARPQPSAPPLPSAPPAPVDAAPASPPAEPTPSPEPSIDIAGLDETTTTALRIRTEFGLRRDLDFIRLVAEDPTATDEFGTPMLPAETAELFARNDRSAAVLRSIRDYLADRAPVFGGLWIDQAAGGIVTLSFTDELDHHRRALAGLLGGRATVTVVQARYSEAVLRTLQDRIVAQDAWFKTIPASLQGVGVDVMENVVSVDVSTTNAAVEQLIVARLGVPPDMIAVHSDGTGAHLLPSGTVRGRVVRADGKPPGNNELMVDARGGDPGWCGGGDIGYGVMPDGRFEIPCKVGRRTIVILALPPNADEWIVVGSRDVEVPANGVIEVVIRLDPT
jgi:hypothetical protein